MINAINEVISTKTVDQYKIIEEKYNILKRYLHNYFEKSSVMTEEDVNLILSALELDYIKYESTEELKEEEGVEML